MGTLVAFKQETRQTGQKRRVSGWKKSKKKSLMLQKHQCFPNELAPKTMSR
jgi:hypothetical protein